MVELLLPVSMIGAQAASCEASELAKVSVAGVKKGKGQVLRMRFHDRSRIKLLRTSLSLQTWKHDIGQIFGDIARLSPSGHMVHGYPGIGVDLDDRVRGAIALRRGDIPRDKVHTKARQAFEGFKSPFREGDGARMDLVGHVGGHPALGQVRTQPKLDFVARGWNRVEVQAFGAQEAPRGVVQRDGAKGAALERLDGLAPLRLALG